MIRIEQALHGYSQGHRLLAQSGALRPDELDQLARLSDLAGYLPTGMSFEQYVTGFPCGRFYAFASTWPDFEAPRSGAVLTHTLLIPLSSASSLADLFTLAELHRSPSKHPISSYEQILEWTPPDTTPSWPSPSAAIKDAVALLLFGQEQRPVVWIDHGDLAPPVRWAWQLLWPGRRMTWSFCTLALQPRTLSGQPFIWLAAPPEARAGLHRLASSRAWWEGGRLTDRTLEKRSGEQWVVALRDPSEACAIVQRTIDAGLPDLEPHQIPVASRFLELEQPATQRLPASRTRADFLGQLAPKFENAPSAWLGALTQLVEYQSSAPLDPRPLWDLEDLLSRRPLQDALVTPEGVDLAQRLTTVVQQELESRICSRPDEAADGLPSLYQHAVACRVSEPMLEVVSRAIVRLREASTGSNVVILAQRIVLDSESAAELVAEVIRNLPRLEQKHLLATLLDSQRDEQDLEIIAARLSDARVALEFRVLRGKDAISSLDVAAGIHLAHGGLHNDWLDLLAATQADDAWTWSLRTEVAPPPLRLATWHWCGQHGNAMSLAGLAQGCERAGEAMSEAGRYLSTPLLREALCKHPELAVATATASLASTNLNAGSIARLAVESTRTFFTFDTAFRAALSASPDSKLVRELLTGLVPELLRQVASPAEQPRPELGDWLAMSTVQQILARSSIYDIEAIFRWRIPHDALGRGLAIVFDLLSPNAFVDISWSTPLLCAFLRATDAQALHRTTERLISIASLPISRPQTHAGEVSPSAINDTHVFLLGEMLGAVRKTHCMRCGPLVAAVFYPVYSRLVSDYPGSLRNCEWWNSMWWDRAKNWRIWLLDTAVNGDWPGSLVRAAAGNDRDLLARLASLARDDRKSRAYWELRL